MLQLLLGHCTIKFLELRNMLAKCAKLSWPPMDNILVSYMLKKATDLTDYLTDAHYCRVHYIRSLMWSQATTKYVFCGILKIKSDWCNRVKADAMEVIKLTKMDCRLWNGMILFKFLSFFLNLFSWYFIYFPFRILTWLYLFWNILIFILYFKLCIA